MITKRQPTAVVTGADRGLGLALTSGLLDTGWRVFTGQYKADWPELGELAVRHSESLTLVPLDVSSQASALEAARLAGEHTDTLDLLISNAGVNSPKRTATICEGQDYEEMHRLYDTNSLGALRMVEAFLPLMQTSAMKRLCFVSSEAGSITRAKRNAWFSYCMSKAALNMGVQLLFNDLRLGGYTFRLYHPGGIDLPPRMFPVLELGYG